MPYFKPSGGGGGGSGSLSGTIGRFLRFIGSSTNAGDSAFAAEDANGINVTGGNLNSTQGSAVSMARGGGGHIGAICLSNVSGSRAETVLTQVLGTGDWSAYTKVLMPSALPTGTQYVWSIFDAAGADAIFINLSASTGGTLVGQAKKTGETTLTVVIASSAFLTQLLGQVVGLGVKRVGNVVTFYINGIAVGSVTGNACTASYTTAAKSQAGNMNSSATPFLGNIYCNRIYNRALSDVEFAAIGSGGVAASDEWGSQSDITAGPLVVGKRYRIKSFGTGDVFTNVGAVSNATGVEFVATGTTPTTWTNSSILTQIGCISAPNFAQGNGATLYDRSPNGLHSVLSGTYTHTIPVKRVVTDDLQVMNDVTGNFGASQGSLPSTVRAAGGTRGGIVFAEEAESRAETVLTGQALGTGAFSVIACFRVGTAVPSVQQCVFTLREDSSNLITLSYRTDGTLQVICQKAGVSVFTLVLSSIQTSLGGQAIVVGVTRSGTTISVVVNGILIVSSTNASADISFTAAAQFVIGNLDPSALNYFTQRIYWCPIYNRLLTTAEVLDAGLYGISAADEWGSCTPVYTSDFSAGVDGWSIFRSTVTGNVDGIGSPSTDNVLRIVCDSTASNTHGASKIISGLIVGKRYRLSGKAFISNSQTLAQGISIADPRRGVSYGVILQSTSWTSFSIEFVASSSSSLAIYLRNNTSGFQFSGNGTDEAYVTDLLLTPIGCIVDIDLAAGQGSTLPGRSTNYLDATLYGSWTHVIPRWSGEWWSRLPWYLFNSISALGANYERAFAKWNSNVFQFGVEKGNTGTLRDFALMSGSFTAILIRALTNLPYANGWRINKGTASITAGSTYTPADTINDLHVVTITGGSGATPIALASLLSDTNYGRVVRIMVKNSSGTSITVSTTGAFTNISQAVADTSQIMITVSIFGTQCFATVAT